ncbi:hypothetical protein CDD83_10658 [Cordyceps sp. RAO-2017]|nr:hypothetical protein CDD83_10658 [Cordyceps sp. RAO-2017]
MLAMASTQPSLPSKARRRQRAGPTMTRQRLPEQAAPRRDAELAAHPSTHRRPSAAPERGSVDANGEPQNRSSHQTRLTSRTPLPLLGSRSAAVLDAEEQYRRGGASSSRAQSCAMKRTKSNRAEGAIPGGFEVERVALGPGRLPVFM